MQTFPSIIAVNSQPFGPMEQLDPASQKHETSHNPSISKVHDHPAYLCESTGLRPDDIRHEEHQSGNTSDEEIADRSPLPENKPSVRIDRQGEGTSTGEAGTRPWGPKAFFQFLQAMESQGIIETVRGGDSKINEGLVGWDVLDGKMDQWQARRKEWFMQGKAGAFKANSLWQVFRRLGFFPKEKTQRASHGYDFERSSSFRLDHCLRSNYEQTNRPRPRPAPPAGTESDPSRPAKRTRGANGPGTVQAWPAEAASPVKVRVDTSELFRANQSWSASGPPKPGLSVAMHAGAGPEASNLNTTLAATESPHASAPQSVPVAGSHRRQRDSGWQTGRPAEWSGAGGTTGVGVGFQAPSGGPLAVSSHGSGPGSRHGQLEAQGRDVPSHRLPVGGTSTASGAAGAMGSVGWGTGGMNAPALPVGAATQAGAATAGLGASLSPGLGATSTDVGPASAPPHPAAPSHSQPQPQPQPPPSHRSAAAVLAAAAPGSPGKPPRSQAQAQAGPGSLVAPFASGGASPAATAASALKLKQLLGLVSPHMQPAPAPARMLDRLRSAQPMGPGPVPSLNTGCSMMAPGPNLNGPAPGLVAGQHAGSFQWLFGPGSGSPSVTAQAAPGSGYPDYRDFFRASSESAGGQAQALSGPGVAGPALQGQVQVQVHGPHTWPAPHVSAQPGQLPLAAAPTGQAGAGGGGLLGQQQLGNLVRGGGQAEGAQSVEAQVHAMMMRRGGS